DRAPDAARLPRRESMHIAIIVDALLQAVDPSETQRGVHRVRIREPFLTGRLLVEPDPQLALRAVVLREPCAKRGCGFEERGLHVSSEQHYAQPGARREQRQTEGTVSTPRNGK